MNNKISEYPDLIDALAKLRYMSYVEQEILDGRRPPDWEDLLPEWKNDIKQEVLLDLLDRDW